MNPHQLNWLWKLAELMYCCQTKGEYLLWLINIYISSSLNELPVIRGHKPRQRRRARQSDVDAIERLQKFVEQKPNKLSRRESMCDVRRVLEYELRVPPRVRSRRRGSVPERFDFERYKKSKKFK